MPGFPATASRLSPFFPPSFCGISSSGSLKPQAIAYRAISGTNHAYEKVQPFLRKKSASGTKVTSGTIPPAEMSEKADPRIESGIPRVW